MLEHTRVSDAASMPEHRNLAQPPTPGLRDWRSQMSREDALAFEQVAGDVLRSAGYELLEPGAELSDRARKARARALRRAQPELEPDRRGVPALAALATLASRARLSGSG